MKQKSPAYQWYPKDILTDQAVVAMSYEEEGLYRHLLDVAWLEDGLPADEDEIFALAKKCKTRSNFDQLWSKISRKFKPGRGGKLRNRRQEVERSNQRKNRKKKQLAAAERWGKGDKKRDARASAGAYAQPMQKACPASASAFPSADQDPQEPREDAPHARPARMELRSLSEVESHLRAACHALIEAHPDIDDGDLAEKLKRVAAYDLKVADYDGRGITKILDAVRGARARRLA